MKTPRSIKAIAVVNKDNPKLSVLNIYKDKDIYLEDDEKICEVEITFKKWSSK